MQDLGVEGEAERAQLLHKPSHAETTALVPTGIAGVWFFIRMSSWWFAFNAVLGSMPAVIWPSQIEDIVGPDKKEVYNGYLPAFGAFVSLIVTPIAGVLSDRSRSPIGRRKLYIVTGSLISLLFLFCLGYFANEGGNLWLFVLYTAGLQFGMNWAAGPFAGLIPDLVHPSQRGTASGYNGLAQVLGYLTGLGIAGVLTIHNLYWRVYTALAVVFVVFSLPTIAGLRENSRLAEATSPMTVKQFFRSFYLDPKKYKSFYWVLITRGLEQMGFYSVMPFFQFFLQDVVKVDDPESSSSVLFMVILISSIPCSLGAGKLSDKFGRKLLVYLSTGLMAIMMAALAATSILHPTYYMLLGLGSLFGVGYGAFLAVDWALALDSLPPDSDTAKDMGIWHVAFVGPQVIAPIISGQVVAYLKEEATMPRAYAAVFTISCMWFLLSAIFVTNVEVQKKKQPTGPHRA